MRTSYIILQIRDQLEDAQRELPLAQVDIKEFLAVAAKTISDIGNRAKNAYIHLQRVEETMHLLKMWM